MIRNRQIDNQKGKLNSGRTTDSGKSFTRGKCLNVSVFVNELERKRERERERREDRLSLSHSPLSQRCPKVLKQKSFENIMHSPNVTTKKITKQKQKLWSKIRKQNLVKKCENKHTNIVICRT